MGQYVGADVGASLMVVMPQYVGDTVVMLPMLRRRMGGGVLTHRSTHGPSNGYMHAYP